MFSLSPIVAAAEPLWSLHTSIAVTGAVAAMSCTVPGVWLVLRRHSMMGDALSHTALPGIVGAFLLATFLRESGWISVEGYAATEQFLLLVGAVAAGLLTAWLTEWVQHVGRVEGNAALGVVFTAFFALGLFVVRMTMDSVHLDLDCVLFGRLVEAAVLDPVIIAGREIPRAVLTNGALLVINLLLVVLFFKELQLASFDPAQATVQGINARVMHYAHMTMTAVTTVAAFESVGSILVIGLLVVPAATALMLTDRLKSVLAIALVAAAASAFLGHAMSQTLPATIFPRLGFPQVEDASTSGMMAVASGLMFLIAWLVSPRHGLLAWLWNQGRLAMRIVDEDLLGALYRHGEKQPQMPLPVASLHESAARSRWGSLLSRWSLWRFSARGLIVAQGDGYALTPEGRDHAQAVVRGHRLWESYLDRHFQLPADHLHESAHRAEHYLDKELREQIAEELNAPQSDPHGRQIPGEDAPTRDRG